MLIVGQSPAAPGEPSWMAIARAELGVAELPGEARSRRIIRYHAEASIKASADEVPWCSAFVNFVMARAGHRGTRSAAARSWLQWGRGVGALPGAIVVLSRGDPRGPLGHVGFLVRAEGDSLWVLGGNQGDAVTFARFPRERALGFRWPL